MLKTLFRNILNRSPAATASARPGPTPDQLNERMRDALACQAEGDLEGAEQKYRSVLTESAENPAALHLLGHVLALQGKTTEAVSALSRAAAQMPEDADVSFNLARALHQGGQDIEAEQALARTVGLRPEFVAAWLTRADILIDLGRFDDAEACYRRALDIDPRFPEAHYNYGNLLHREGRISECIVQYRAAVELKPEFARAHSNLVYALNFSDELSPEEVAREHFVWARQHAEPLTAAARPHVGARAMRGLLRVGYVSPNFRNHAVTYFFESTLAHHNPERILAHCYSDVTRPDAYTERLRMAAPMWRDIAGKGDEAVAELIRRDAIDILVDLTGHTDDHRLMMFARKPAPVQVTWNGYANTTGMRAMDYRITDAYCDPPGMTERLHSEKLVRLPEIYMAFSPPRESPPVSPLPLVSNGRITYGSFNALAKVTPKVIETWARLLHATRDSRLLMLTVPEGRARENLLKAFAAHGIAPERVECQGRLPFSDFLAAHARADIALDPFPFNGTTTTCHTLWMGVPVITLAGSTHVSRVGLSLLANAGLEQCVAMNEGEYLEKAVALASNTRRLEELRLGLRERLLSSPVSDGARLTRFLEDAYLKMWEDYCHQTARAGT